ncbi:MAG: ATP-binding protein [Thalassotalea sp.]
MKIFTKLLISLVVMTSLLFASLFVLLQWSFDKGMLDYINQRELKGLESLANNLITVHAELGDFSQLKAHPRIWHETVKASMAGKSFTQVEVKALINEKRSTRKRPEHRPPPHRDETALTQKPALQHRGFHEGGGPPPGHRPAPKHLVEQDHLPNQDGFNPNRLPSLLSAEKQVILGSYQADFSTLAITKNNKTLAYLALPPAKKLTSSFDLAFSKSQQSTWLIIFIAGFSVTLLVTILLSRYLIKGIQTLANATHQLNSGKYDIQLQPKGKDELANLARNFNDLAQTLSQNESSRKAWLANISHELRTPLAIVKGELEALQDGIRPVTPDSLQSLADEVIHLQKLIDDLNQLSNAEIGALNYQKAKINISALVAQNIQRRAADIDQHGITLVPQITNNKLDIWGDSTRINQLFDNLITNSLKYTDSPGQLHITITKSNQQAQITIEDSSPSVPKASIAKLFDHLYRVENSRNRKTGGSGLGLAICQKIVQAHQGEITAYPSPQGGLGIKVTLALI